MKLNEEIGFVIKCQDYLVTIEGLPSARINDLLYLENQVRAIVYSLEGSQIQALMLDYYFPKPGESFRLNEEGIKIPLGLFLLGRAVNPLGVPVDGKENLPTTGPKLELDVVAPGINFRELIHQQFETGFSIVDQLLPIGVGQRELILGDARSGKSAFLLDLIAHQKNQNTICIYTALGKPEIDIKRFSQSLEALGASPYTVVLAAASSSSAPLITLAPACAFFMAEYFQKKGRDVLLILDDLGAHAKYLREVGLLAGETPGRESYPGNIFYAHAHLMERAGKFSAEAGGGSITLLPILETDLDNLTNLIPTNLMSQTDGHLLFSSARHAQGYYPAIEISRSVTRVGRQTQYPLQKTLAAEIRKILAEYESLEGFSLFETELSNETQLLIKRARLISEILRQEEQETRSLTTQLILLGLIFTSLLEKNDLDFLRRHKAKMTQAIDAEPDFAKLVRDHSENPSLENFIEALKEALPQIEKVCR